MKILDSERRALNRKPSASNNPAGRPMDPDGDNATADRLGLSRSLWRHRMRKVRAGKMTLEEAKSLPPQTPQQAGKRAAKARWGGTKG